MRGVDFTHVNACCTFNMRGVDVTHVNACCTFKLDSTVVCVHHLDDGRNGSGCMMCLCYLSAPVIANSKPGGQARETAPKRSLNLEDYKKRRGLI